MRYYKLDITNATTGKAIVPASLGGLAISSLLADGSTNLAALDIELDLPVAPYAQPAGAGYVRIRGLGLQDIGSAADLNDALISVYGGMAKGLPLANPAQSGLLVKGQIFQAFGNWVGTEQSVDLLLQPATGTDEQPVNLVLNWTAGQQMSAALGVSLLVAFPEAKQNISISENLVLGHNETGYYSTLSQFSSAVNEISKSIIQNENYAGVDIGYDGTTITVSDGTSAPSAAKKIAFQDLIGQPTWIEPLTIQAKLVMRADLHLFDLVSLPPSLLTTTASSQARFADKTSFSGNYLITDLHHYGSFRQPDAAAWNTTINMIPAPKGS